MATIPNIFEQRRQRVQQQQTAQGQEELDALKRRLASLGGLSSGTAIQIEQQAREKQGQRMAGALGEVDVQEQEFNLAQQEAEKQRQFQAGESSLQRQSQLALQREGQTFQSGENALQRSFITGESAAERASREKMQVSQQEFAALESRMGREAAKELADMQLRTQSKLAEMDDKTKRLGIITQQDIAAMNATAQENLTKMQLKYQQTKDSADRAIVEKQMKNELNMALMTQAIDLAQMAKAGLKPSDVASMMNSFLKDAVVVNPNGTFKLNSNWNPAFQIAQIGTESGATALPVSQGVKAVSQGVKAPVINVGQGVGGK